MSFYDEKEPVIDWWIKKIPDVAINKKMEHSGILTEMFIKMYCPCNK